jgi:hypothetical protein
MNVYEKLSEEIRNGQPIHIGRFYQEKTGETWKKTPIEWIIISKSVEPYGGDRQKYVLELISKKVLYYSQWDCNTYLWVNWLESGIRRKLQEQLHEIFNNDELHFIQPVLSNKDCIYDETTKHLSDASYDKIVNSNLCKKAKEKLLEKDRLYLISYDFKKFKSFCEMENANEINSKDLHESFATDYAIENCSIFDHARGPDGVMFWTKTVIINKSYYNDGKEKIHVGKICGLGTGGGEKSPDHIAGIRPCITIEIVITL